MGETGAGRFFAVGVGPGDPELLTLRAVHLIRQADVIYHAGPAADSGRALEIVRSFLRPEQPTCSVRAGTMMEASAADWRLAYRAGVERIAADCRAGRAAVFIAEGDPTLYSTAAHVWQLLAELAPEVPIEIVPGVSSIMAAAARIRWPLAQKDEPLLLVPASYHPGNLRDWLGQFPGICLLKPGKVLASLHGELEQLGYEAVYIEEVGTAREWLTTDLREAAGRNNYFALVLLRRRAESSAAPEVSRPRLKSVRVVGLGPGDPRLLTLQARQALDEADVIVGYERYLEPLRALGLRAELVGSPIGAEVERARQALALARSGRRVVVVSSGDAGVFGMASLLLEAAAQDSDVAIEVLPGVTAALAASARLGAPLGHDFACISLSDLLTPWEVIERRLEAAGRGDLVVALYNPVSQRRTWQLPRARDILLRHREQATPVGVVERAYRPGEHVRLTMLGDLTVDGIDMETIVIVGSRATRVVGGRMITPRRDCELRIADCGLQEAEHVSTSAGFSTTSNPQSAIRNPQFAGRSILEQSFAIIEKELAADPQSAINPQSWEFAVVRRMIHASADFDFARTLRYSADFADAVERIFRERLPIVTDTEMVLLGIRRALSDLPGMTLACHLNDPQAPGLADTHGLTRSAAGIRLAARKHSSPMLVIGNAPTALDEALRLVVEEVWRPAAIVGLPVGFVGVEEGKGRLLNQTQLPYLTCVGRKGGSAVAAAAVNALAEFWAGRE